MIETLQAENLKSVSGIRHGFFTRNGGASDGIYASLNCGLSSADNPEFVAENRRRAAARFGLGAESLLSCYQVHSPDVVTVREVWNPENRPRADAMVTAKRGIALGVLTADCVPLLFSDEAAGVIGAAHAGWRGAVGGVIENTIVAMERLGAKRDTIHAAIGACIWQDSYEVGTEFPALLAPSPQPLSPPRGGEGLDRSGIENCSTFQRGGSPSPPLGGERGWGEGELDVTKFLRPSSRQNHHMFDLPGYVTARLRGIGITSIEPSPADTCADDARFFSYRHNCLNGISKVGSLISVIARE